MNNKKMVGINVWKKESGSYMSHGSGLTPEQIEMLRSAKPGDRIIISPNVRSNNAGSYDYYVRIYEKDYKAPVKDDRPLFIKIPTPILIDPPDQDPAGDL